MKQLVLSVIFIFLFSLTTLVTKAEEKIITENNTPYQQRIMKTGFRLLNGSLCEKRITFFFDCESKPKVKVSNRNKRITVSKGVFPYIENDDEMAAVLSTAIAHLQDCHDGFFRRFSMSFSPRKYETKADKKAVDIMVKAGYNPIGLINILTKTSKENSWFEYNIYHHNGSERLAYVYQYIYEKYPIYIAQNEYLKEDSYQNFLRISKNERKKTRLIQQHKLKNKNNQNTLKNPKDNIK